MRDIAGPRLIEIHKITNIRPDSKKIKALNVDIGKFY